MKMKKLLKSAVFVTALFAASFAEAGTYRFESFINGYAPGANSSGFSGNTVAIMVTNSTTNSYGQSNVVYYVQGVPFGYTYGTNYTLVTNAFINPVQWAANSGTNIFYSQWLSLAPSTNATSTNTLPPAFVDIVLPADANQDPAQVSLSFTFTQDNIASSNNLTFTVAKSADGINFGSTTASQIAVYFTPVATYNAATQAATNPFTIITNLPTSFTTGARKLRLLSIISATNSGGPGTNVFINSAGVGIFTP